VRLFVIYLVFATFFAESICRPYAVALPTLTARQQIGTEEYLRLTAKVLTSLKTYGNAIALGARKSDQAFLRKELKDHLNSPVKIIYVERDTLSISLGSERASIKAKDLAKGRFEILKREFVFDPSESAEAGIKRIGKILNQAGHTALFEPRADAIAFLAILGTIWLTGGAMGTYQCTQAVNTPGWCATVSFGWPLIAMWMAGGAIYRSIFDRKDYLKEMNLDLLDFHCSDGVKPMQMTLVDKDGNKLATEVYYTDATKPDRIEIKSQAQEPTVIHLAHGWSYDTEKPMDSSSDAKIKSTQDVMTLIHGMQDLNKACLDPDARVVIEKYSELHARDANKVVSPKPDSATQITK
jgi:hypothetical protein